MRRPRLPLFVLALLAAACGGDGPTSPSAAPPPPPSDDSGSLRMTLLAHLDGTALAGLPAAGSGCWGYTSPKERRFALTGTSRGLSIVEITDPRNPRKIAFIEGNVSSWREMKTYGEYVYVTTEARTGLDIIDMRNPDRPVKVQTWNTTFTSAHSLWIDQARGLLFANGTSSGMHVLDVKRNPRDPVDVGSFTTYYVHDSYSRGTTLYASAITSGFLALLDVSDPAGIREVTRFNTGGFFTHNSWLTGDGRYVFTTDERAGRPLEGWDIADPFRPRKVSEYLARPGAIPHNVMIDGDRLIVSHYTEGVHMLDVSNPERLGLLGFYDTYAGPSQGFAGAWGAYIFPGSNVIVVSDINGGLFVVGYTG